MAVSDRRTAALKRTVQRRTRIEETLRAKLATQREQQAHLEAERDAKREAVLEQTDLLQTYRNRIAAMMGGDTPFSLADMNAGMRYIEIVEQRLRACEDALAQAEERLQAHAAELAATVRAIANNRGRIDLCEKRIEHIARAGADAASDAADEEAEEAVLARMRLAGQAAV